MSSLFTQEKRDGSYRMILNLKQLNKHNEYEHFKIESLQSVLNIIRPICWRVNVNLKVLIHPDYQKFLKFKWQEYCHAFRGMPNGFSETIRVFAKLRKLPFSILRSHGYLSAVFVDDSYLQGHTFSTCEDNVNAAVDLFHCLGFAIDPEKSVLVPTQEMQSLGFFLNSVEMKIKLTNCKSGKIILKIKKFLHEEKQTIRDLASVIGSLVATFPVLRYGKLHNRELERCKIFSLKFEKDKHNAPFMPLSSPAIAELHKWLKHLKNPNQLLTVQ